MTGPGAITLADFIYSTDATGNITGISDAVDSSFDRAFGYDDLNRLTSASTGASLWGAGAYAYDALGNLLSEYVGDWSASFAYDCTTPRISMATEQTVAFPVEYDATGNEIATTHIARPGPGGLVSGAGDSEVVREYSPRNLLERVSVSYRQPCSFPCRPPWPPPIVDQYDYSYDGRGVRVHLSGERGITYPFSSSFSLDYVYTPELHLSAIRDPLGETTEFVWFNGHPVAQITPSGPWIAYTFTDHLGTPIVQTDSGGNITWFGDYEPYGRLYNLRAGDPATQPLRLPGQDEAAHSLPGAEESYNIFRWYRAGWGRYMQADPIRAGAALDPYGYARQRPTVLFDPLGLQARGTSTNMPFFSSCCDRALAAGLFDEASAGGFPAGGIVICCNGTKVPCAKTGDVSGWSSGVQRAYGLAIQCVLKHEDQHVRDLPDCPCGNDVPPLKLASFPSGQRGPSECTAAGIELDCLERSKQQCSGDAVCMQALEALKAGPAGLQRQFGCR